LAEVRLSTAAVQDLDRMVLTHSLPPDTRERLRRSLRVLEQFPRIGRQLEGRWKPLRFILGQWRWMLIIYSYEEPDDVVLVVAFQDGRSSAGATVS
jgi:plasmid stabilization system protein ParE